METELSLEFVDTELAIMPFLFQHVEGDKAALEHVPFQIRNRPSAIPKGALHAAMSGMRRVVRGAVGRTELSDGDENLRQVSGCRHCGWREMPSFSMR